MKADPQLFWTIVAAIGQVAGAVATAVAVITSLWIALSERRVRLRVTSGLRLMFVGDGTPGIGLVVVSITNSGYRRARISAVGWETGWSRNRFAPAWLAKQYAVQQPGHGSPRPPFDLEPGENKLLFIRVSDFRRPGRAEVEDDFFRRHLPWQDRATATRIVCTVFVTVGPPTKVKVEQGLASYLATGDLTANMLAFTLPE